MLRCSLLIVLAVAAPAFAQSPWYAGVSGGRAETNRELVQNRESTILFATDLHTDFDRSDGAWKAFAGFRFNRVMALELTYADLGGHRMFTTMQGGIPPLPASIAIDRRISGYGVDIVATAPLGFERFNLFGRIGSFRSRLEASAQLDGNIVFYNGPPEERSRSTTRQESVLKWGVGADWSVARHAAVRLEFERYDRVGKPFAIEGVGTTGEADTDVVSLGFVWKF